jgi:hypothetical protein
MTMPSDQAQKQIQERIKVLEGELGIKCQYHDDEHTKFNGLNRTERSNHS